eukprot:TRINITY_DN29429_c0_g1_i1.p1 TRINITY_DN29429_c0_g1~~TRINITY_DN29429_c0_g1_i1.p1  ORF type:complete len:565 (+),score=63.03 TRINITY_DN29429_c0_g1_i1:395-2089(+)
MLAAMNASNCFRFLAAVDKLPGEAGTVHDACMHFIEHSLPALSEALDAGKVDIRGDMVKLSCSTMLSTCTHVGLGIGAVKDPTAFLEHIMPAVLQWGKVAAGDELSPRELYCLLKELPPTFHTFSHTFKVTRGNIKRRDDFSSDEFSLSGYSFKTNIECKTDNEDYFGVYLVPVSRGTYPDWWQCHASFVFHEPAFFAVPSSVISHVFGAKDRGYGEHYFLAHSARSQTFNSFKLLRPRQLDETLDRSTWLTVGANGLMKQNGKFYHEVVLADRPDVYIGWATCDFVKNQDHANSKGVGQDEHSWAADGIRQKTWHNNKGKDASWPRRWEAGDVIGCAIDTDAALMMFSLNGKWVTTSGLRFAACGKAVFLAVTVQGAVEIHVLRTTWKHSPPGEGYLPWADSGDFSFPALQPLHRLPLQDEDLEFELNIETKISVNSILSLCMAYAFFHDSCWSELEPQHLKELLSIDSLHVLSEDELLSHLLSLGMPRYALNEALKSVRWQFISPAKLLNSFHNESFRECDMFGRVLTWFIIQRERPGGYTNRKRLRDAQSVSRSNLTAVMN